MRAVCTGAEDDDARKAGGLVLQQVCRYAAQRLDSVATAALLPLALRGRYDPDAAIAAAAADIMTELGASAASVLRTSAAAAASPVIVDLSATATRARRVAAAAAAAGFATDGGAALAPPTAVSLAAALVAALPGRAWAGKEAVPSALAAVAAAVPAAFTAAPLPRPDPPIPDGASAPDDSAIVSALAAAAVKSGGREVAEAAAEALVKVLEAFKDRDHFARLEVVLKCLEGQQQREKQDAEAGTPWAGAGSHITFHKPRQKNVVACFAHRNSSMPSLFLTRPQISTIWTDCWQWHIARVTDVARF